MIIVSSDRVFYIVLSLQQHLARFSPHKKALNIALCPSVRPFVCLVQACNSTVECRKKITIVKQTVALGTEDDTSVLDESIQR